MMWGSRGLMDRALDLKPEITRGCGFESRLWQEVSTTEVRPLSKAPNPQLLPGRHSVSFPLLQVCALGWVKCRENISLLIILCTIVYVTNKAHLSLICVFVCDNLTDWGNKFHGLGAKTEKALSPLDFRQDNGTVNRFSEEDLRDLRGKYGQIRSEMQTGARPCKALNTKVKTLYSILNLTGSQCRCTKIGVICFLFFFPLRSGLHHFEPVSNVKRITAWHQHIKYYYNQAL